MRIGLAWYLREDSSESISIVLVLLEMSSTSSEEMVVKK
jgi:hypothetical protein